MNNDEYDTEAIETFTPAMGDKPKPRCTCDDNTCPVHGGTSPEMWQDAEPAPAKPADAHAAGAHTPENYGSGYPYNEHDKLTVTLSETAAECDRLRLELDEAQRTYTYDTAQLKQERDQAREQVKTLLAACKRFSEFSFTDYEARFNTTAAIGRLVMLKRAARASIASVESEEAK